MFALKLNVGSRRPAARSDARQIGSAAEPARTSSWQRRPRHFLDELLHLPAHRPALVFHSPPRHPTRRRMSARAQGSRVADRGGVEPPKQTGGCRDSCSWSSNPSTAPVSQTEQHQRLFFGRGFSFECHLCNDTSVPERAHVEFT